MSEELTEKSQIVTEPMLLKVVNSLTSCSVEGIHPKGDLNKFWDGFVSSRALAADYLSSRRYSTNDMRVAALIRNESLKAGAVGFVTGFGGFVSMPVTLPADIVGTWAVQARMVGAIAEIYGYSVHEPDVQTGILLCLLGGKVSEQVLQGCGVKVAKKLSAKLIDKIPGKILTQINKAVGFRFLTKSGEKGIVNLTKLIPVFGAIVSGGFDNLSTKAVGKMAQRFYSADINESL